MPELKRLRTLLLGLAVILITFTIFIALPARLPEFKLIGCDKLMWACSLREKAPVKYDTWTWLTPEQPDYTGWAYAHTRILETDDILDGLHRDLIKTGLGALNIEVDPEFKNRINVSGYLQYGYFIEWEEKILPPMTLQNVREYIILETLYYPETHGVLRNRNLNVFFEIHYRDEVRTEILELTTDRNGFFSYRLELDEGFEYYTFITGIGTETVVPKSPKQPIEVYLQDEVYYTSFIPKGGGFETRDEKRTWIYIILVVALIGGLLYWYIRYRHRYVPGYEEFLLPAKEAERAGIFREKEPETGGDTDRLEISLPDIEEHLPGVWGVNEPMNINIRLIDGHGKPVPGQVCEIGLVEGETLKETSDEEGRIICTHAFTLTGDYLINARYTDEETGREISSWRKIRIVDYREEMVRLFNEMLKTFNIMDISIDPEMTAREVETLLTDKLEGVSREAIRNVVNGFEEANYSTHPVSRESYVAMYPAVMEVLDYDV